MNRLRSVVIAAVSAVGLVAGAQTVRAQAFSADVTNTDPNAPHRDGPTHMTVSGQKMRIDTGHGAMIIDGQASTAIMLQPDKKMAFTMGSNGTPAFTRFMVTFDPENACAQWQALSKGHRADGDATWNCEKVGSDSLGGRSVIKYEATNAKGEHATAWIDTKLRFPIRVDSAHGGMTLSNIQEGPQPANQFEVPAGYQTMDMSAMMQGMGKFKGGMPGATPQQ